jgi:GNAT superfamily N-acetyltransferase
MNTVLRQATMHDAASIWAVRYAVTQNTLTPGRLSDEDLRREIEDTGRGWVAEVDGRIEGFAIGNAESGNIWALFVHPRAQGQGLGARLHTVMLDWLATQPVQRLWLSTGVDTDALAFYERRGWQRAGLTASGEMRLERINWATEVHDEVPGAPAQVVDQGLGEANEAAAPLHEVRGVSCFVRDEGGAVIGGAVGRTWGRCAELQQLWVAPTHRGQGLGARLVRLFEARAVERGCDTFYLQTFSFQAPRLYRALGYEAETTIAGYGGGIEMMVMVKRLAPP